jgi:hypothetical protein
MQLDPSTERQVLIISNEIVQQELVAEKEIFSSFSRSMLDNIFSNFEDIDARNYQRFGGNENLISYFILAFVAAVAKDLSKEGISLLKKSLKHWYHQNQKKINKNTSNKSAAQAIKLIDKFLLK